MVRHKNIFIEDYGPDSQKIEEVYHCVVAIYYFWH